MPKITYIDINGKRHECDVAAGVSVMEGALNRGRDSSEKVQDTLQALRDIYEAVNKINDMNAQIATAAEEQSQVANEINRNVVSIAQMATDTTNDAQESHSTGTEIVAISQRLSALVMQAGHTNAAEF